MPSARARNAIGSTPLAVQGQFNHDDEILDLIRLDLLTRGEYPYRDLQIEVRPFLFDVRRRQVDQGPADRKLKTRIDQRRAHAVLGFL